MTLHELRHHARPSRRAPVARARSACSRRCRSIICARPPRSPSGVLERLRRPTICLLHARGEVAVLVEHVGDAAGHAGGEVAPGRAEHDDAAAGHVFAAVVADAFDDGVRRRCCARRSVRRPCRGCKPRRSVAPYSATLPMMMFSSGDERRACRRIDDELAARQTLADVVVGVAFELERHAARHERAEALARGAVELDAESCPRADPSRRTCCVISLPVIVPTTRLTLRIGSSALTRLAALDARACADVEQLRDVERFLEAVVLRRSGSSGRRPGRRRAGTAWLLKSRPLRLPVIDRLARLRAGRRGRPFPRACGSRAAP